VSPRQRFTIPRDPRKADELAGELGALATAVAWQRAAIVYARVRVQEAQGRPTAKKANSGLLSPAQYALRGIHGLRSRTTVRSYWKAWDAAVADGIAQPVSLGDEVELPDAEWEDYYHLIPNCDPWANTSQREPAWRGHRRDDLEEGDCPPRSSDVDQPEWRQPWREPVTPELLNARALDGLKYSMAGLEQRAKEILKSLNAITDWDGSGEAALESLGRIRKLLNDIERTVRRGTTKRKRAGDVA
jgi:hypothetical protein